MSNPGALTDLKYEYGDGIVLCTDSWNPNSKLWSATKTISGHSTIHIKAHFFGNGTQIINKSVQRKRRNWKIDFISWHFLWNIRNANARKHTCGHPFLLGTFLYSSKWRLYKEQKEIPWGYRSVPEISHRSFHCKLNLQRNTVWEMQSPRWKNRGDQSTQRRCPIPRVEQPLVMQSRIGGTPLLSQQNRQPWCAHRGAAHLPPMPLCHVRTGGTLHFQGDFTLPGCGPQHPLGIQTTWETGQLPMWDPIKTRPGPAAVLCCQTQKTGVCLWVRRGVEGRKEVCSNKPKQPRASPEHSSTPHWPAHTSSHWGQMETSTTACWCSQPSLRSPLCNVLTCKRRTRPHRHLDSANIRWQTGRPARVRVLG